MGNLLNKNIEWKVFNRLPLIKENEIHIFKIDTSLSPEESEICQILSTEELCKAQKFLRKYDKREYLSRKYYLRVILSIFTRQNAKNITYQYGQFKKPEVPEIHFNLSHTKGFITIAVSSKTVGIDMEYNEYHFNFTELLNSCFSEEEISYIKEHGETSLEFYTLWTRKEAILKATGEGLVENLNTVAVLNAKQKRAEEIFSIMSYYIDNLLISIAHPVPVNKVNFWLYS